MLLLLTALVLSLWFYRQRTPDASLWMLATYAGIGLLAYQDFTAVGTYGEAFPKILKDFILLGMVGFVQTMAVNKRIPVWMAVVLIFGMFAAVHVLDDLIPADEEDGAERPHQLARDGAYLDKDVYYETYLVELDSEQPTAAFRRAVADRNWTFEPAFLPEDDDRTLLDNYVVVNVGPQDYPDLAPVLEELPNVVYAEPNEVIQAWPLLEPSPPATAPNSRRSLSINDPGTGQQWVMEVLEMNEYYQQLSGLRPAKKAKLAILDTGVDARHEDLDDNYVSTEKRYDNDPVGHGTHCAGIAAGVTNNGIGIGSLAGAGDSPFVEVTSIKVLNAGGMGTQKTIIAGIIEAVDEGADVISLSLGGASNRSRQRAYSQAVRYATDRGIIVVAAAGNSNRNAANYAPANADGIITVAALDELLLRAPFSNRVDEIARSLAAPGVGIYSTVPNNNYKRYSGTSMACPFVAGLAGVLKSLDPNLDAQAMYELLHATGREGNETRVTGRIVQPADALRAVIN